MKQTKLTMGMPVTVEILDVHVTLDDFHDVFRFLRKVDEQFSPYKKTSEVSLINRKEESESEYSETMKEILSVSEQTKKESQGFFDVYYRGYFDPSGIVKGWAIQKVSDLLKKKGFHNFYVDAGGDIQVSGLKNAQKWIVGIRNPFYYDQVVKKVALSNAGIATSGTAIRGDHIYNPHQKNKQIKDIVSLSVIAPHILDADRFATAAFAMEREGIDFINSLPGAEGYMIDSNGIATYTVGFEKYVIN